MNIVITNDDGVFAPGIAELAVAFEDEDWLVRVVAPEEDRMGQSAALNLKQGIAVRKLPCNHWGVQGTPADAAHLACSGLLDPMPDILVSGINHGSNAGDAIYSGTVMACTAGVWCSLPPVAVSMVDDGHRRFDTAAKCAVDWIKRMKARKDRFGSVAFPQDIAFSINVPDIFYSQIKGWKTTITARRQCLQPCKKIGEDEGRFEVWMLGEQGDSFESWGDTDIGAISRGFVSVTPIKFDITNYSGFDCADNMVEEINR